MNRGDDFCFGIECAHRETYAAVLFYRPQLRVHERRAMKAGADGDVMVDIKHDSHVTRIDALHVHQNRREMILQLVATIQAHAIDLSQAFHQLFGELRLMRVHLLDSVFVKPVLACPEGRHSHHIRSAELEAPRIFFQMVRIDRAHSGTAAAHLCDCNMLTDTKTADAHAAHQGLVPGERDHINIHFFHIDRNHAGGLRCVHKEGYAVLATKAPHFAERLHGADHVGAVIDNQ